MWQKYLERALRYKMLADYYRSQDSRKYRYYNERYLQNQKRFVEEYEKGRGRVRQEGSPVLETDERGEITASGQVRVLHAYTSIPRAVDVYVNDRLVAQSIPFAAITSYLRLPEGTYHIHVYESGERERPLIHQAITVGANPYTLAIIDDVSRATDHASLLAYEDDLKSVRERAKVRFIHLSPNAPRVDVAIKRGNVLFSNVGFTDARFMTVPPGTYDLEIRIASTNQVIYIIPQVHLDARKVYSIFAVGRIRGNPAFRVLVVQDH